MNYNFMRLHQTLKISPAMAAGVTDRLWEIGDIVDMLESWETKEKRAQPMFEVVQNKIGGNYFIRATLVDGTVDRIDGFATEGEAGRWIRNESVVWLSEHRLKLIG